jgi:plasmid stabilization system protein ParE
LAYRLSGAAEDQIHVILLESAKTHGFAAADRYGPLILTAITSLARNRERWGL